MERVALHCGLQTGNFYTNKVDTRDLPMGSERRIKLEANFGILGYPPLLKSLSPRLSLPVKDPLIISEPASSPEHCPANKALQSHSPPPTSQA